ncbi:MAG: transposase [bacterium]|nr:transposase [bacterium]
MRKSRYSEEQIIGVLRQVEQGQKVADACREHGIAVDTYYRWRKKYGGMEVADARRLKHVEDENRKLRKLVADLTLDKEALKDALGRKW